MKICLQPCQQMYSLDEVFFNATILLMLPLLSQIFSLQLLDIVMADPFSTVAAVVSLADVMIRACGGISNLVVDLRDGPNAVQHLRQTLQNVHSVLGNLRLYVIEYESSKLFIEQHQLLPEIVKRSFWTFTQNQTSCISFYRRQAPRER